MLFRLLLLINLFGFISNLTIKDFSFQYERATDYFSLSYTVGDKSLHPPITLSDALMNWQLFHC